MPVQNVECQIARLQIGRFLKGEVLPPDMMAQLEAHIGRCPECRAELAGRKAELQALANGRKETAMDAAPTASPTSERPAQARPSAPRPKSEAPRKAAVATPPAAAPFPWKALAYSLALAGVLVAMSFVAKDPTALLGPRLESPAAEPSGNAAPRTVVRATAQAETTAASFPTIYVPSMEEPIDREALQASASAEPAAKPQDAAQAGPEATEAAGPTSEPKPATPPPARQPAAARADRTEPKPIAQRPRATRRPVARRSEPPAHRPAPSLRVYDEHGRPIQP